MKKKGTPEDLIWPWSLDDFRGSPGDKKNVLENLTKRNFRPMDMVTEKDGKNIPIPNKRIINVTGRLLCEMLNDKEDGNLPWLLMMSNSMPLLQSISGLMPIVYSLTTIKSCAITSTAQLSDLFYSRRGQDLDASEEILHDVQRAGFLVWENIGDTVQGTAQQSGRFASLMDHRMRYNLCTIFTATYMEWAENTVKKILSRIEQSFGSSTATMVSRAKQANLQTDLVDHSCQNIKV